MTIQKLLRIWREGKCVTWKNGKHMPTAFLCSMQFSRVMQYLPDLKPYKPKNK